MKKIFIIAVSAFFIFSSYAFSQVGIYPQAVFLDMQNRSSNVRVINNSDQPKEIIIDMEYGYSGLDSLGNSFIEFKDTLTREKHSAIPYVKVFPKKILLKAKEDQIVRFMLGGNIANAEDGTYYGRIKVKSKNPPKEIDTSNKGKITATVEIQFSMIAALFVQKGKKECSLKITSNSVFVDSASVNVFVGFEREGNSPFLGTAELNIYDMNGNKVADSKAPSPIYFNSKKAYPFKKSLFKEGKYKVELGLTNEHQDIPDEFKIKCEPVNASFIIDLAGKLK